MGINNRETILLDTNCFIYYFEDNPSYADIASRLRANYNIKTPDAIILATGISMNVDCFITNDIKLKSVCSQENIETIIIEDIKD